MRIGNKYNKKSKQNINNPVENMKIVSFNTQYYSMAPYVDSTVVKISDNVIKGSLFSKDNRFRSEEYLLNYKANNNYIGYRIGISNFFQESAVLTSVNLDLGEEIDDVIAFPKPKKIRTGLSVVIKNRRSVRKYSKSIMSMQDFSNILYYSQGIADEVPAYNLSHSNKNIKLRNTPSAGGLYPIELYVLVINVKNLSNGIYKYYPYSHSIKPINTKIHSSDVRKFAEFGYINVEDSNLLIMYIYNMLVNTRKYGDAGMTYALIETGEIAQNLQLVSTALGYGACDIGGYEKQYVEEVIKIDGIQKHVVHMNIVGTEKEE
ncbi:SagB family peptide dehydrogenase [Haloimpatiens sp. FM7330]|uniref:SagB family peptide dehydrogenase n=1 Tax=Haloimpatiens sp. FM7330 TaxID=3298610 RepID=UPI0036331630